MFMKILFDKTHILKKNMFTLALLTFWRDGPLDEINKPKYQHNSSQIRKWQQI